jgi:hypothetical protein
VELNEMLTAMLSYLVVMFIFEVVYGSSVGVYNAEIGYESSSDQLTQLPPKQFFLQLLPFALLCTGGVFYLLHCISFLVNG